MFTRSRVYKEFVIVHRSQRLSQNDCLLKHLVDALFDVDFCEIMSSFCERSEFSRCTQDQSSVVYVICKTHVSREDIVGCCVFEDLFCTKNIATGTQSLKRRIRIEDWTYQPSCLQL